jgi:hypothetical protein
MQLRWAYEFIPPMIPAGGPATQPPFGCVSVTDGAPVP